MNELPNIIFSIICKYLEYKDIINWCKTNHYYQSRLKKFPQVLQVMTRYELSKKINRLPEFIIPHVNLDKYLCNQLIPTLRNAQLVEMLFDKHGNWNIVIPWCIKNGYYWLFDKAIKHPQFDFVKIQTVFFKNPTWFVRLNLDAIINDNYVLKYNNQWVRLPTRAIVRSFVLAGVKCTSKCWDELRI